MDTPATQTKFTIEVDMIEICAIEAGLQLLKHFNVNGPTRTCIVTDRCGAPSFTRMSEIENTAKHANRALNGRELDALIRKVTSV